jgi:hypothetical protein
MKEIVVPLLAGVFATATLMAGTARSLPIAQFSATGTIKGHARLNGRAPGNGVIRMGKDPKCAAMNKGKQVIQEAVKATLDGSLANVFVHLEGAFPGSAVPKSPVVINQHGCFYEPRVVGVRVGQELQIKNSDSLLHNVHSISNSGNQFNVAQARAGVVDSFRMKKEEVMLRLGCDVHSWMVAYVGVVTNPYFAVSDASGVFVINNVPPGTYTIDAWHERFGSLKKTVKVTAGATATVDFSYPVAGK